METFLPFNRNLFIFNPKAVYMLNLPSLPFFCQDNVWPEWAAPPQSSRKTHLGGTQQGLQKEKRLFMSPRHPFLSHSSVLCPSSHTLQLGKGPFVQQSSWKNFSSKQEVMHVMPVGGKAGVGHSGAVAGRSWLMGHWHTPCVCLCT